MEESPTPNHLRTSLNRLLRHFLFHRRRYTQDDWPYITELTLEEGTAGKTDVAALVVMDGIQDAKVSQPSAREYSAETLYIFDSSLQGKSRWHCVP